RQPRLRFGAESDFLLAGRLAVTYLESSFLSLNSKIVGQQGRRAASASGWSRTPARPGTGHSRGERDRVERACAVHPRRPGRHELFAGGWRRSVWLRGKGSATRTHAPGRLESPADGRILNEGGRTTTLTSCVMA